MPSEGFFSVYLYFIPNPDSVELKVVRPPVGGGWGGGEGGKVGGGQCSLAP